MSIFSQLLLYVLYYYKINNYYRVLQVNQEQLVLQVRKVTEEKGVNPETRERMDWRESVGCLVTKETGVTQDRLD